MSIPLKIAGVRISKDGRCGFPNLAWDGGPVAECDPQSGDPCCSPFGFCGISDEHCKCERCIDFRSPNSRKSNFVVHKLVIVFASKIISEK